MYWYINPKPEDLGYESNIHNTMQTYPFYSSIVLLDHVLRCIKMNFLEYIMISSVYLSSIISCLNKTYITVAFFHFACLEYISSVS